MIRLDAELYRDPDAYHSAVEMFLSERSDWPRTPEYAQDCFTYFLVQAGLRQRWFREMWPWAVFDVVKTANRLAVAGETWEDIDRDRARELLVGTLDCLNKAHPAEPIVSGNRLHRVLYSTPAVVKEAPCAAALIEYLNGLATLQRIHSVSGDVCAYLESSVIDEIPRRHRERFSGFVTFGWFLGVYLGFLEVVGEIPPEGRAGIGRGILTEADRHRMAESEYW